MEIARMAGLHFIVNAVLDVNGEVAKVVAGHMEEAFEAGVRYAKDVFEAEIEEQADIVITGVRPPKDANLFQATRGASYVALSPYPSVKKGGMIIVPAATPEGAGKGPGERTYYHITSQAKDLDGILEGVRNRPSPAGSHRAYVMAMTLKHANVAVAGSATPEEVRRLFMSSFASTEEAVEAALARYGETARIYVIPDSLHVLTSKSKTAVESSSPGRTRHSVEVPVSL
jgi:nickel-dependent lactate racemase